MSDEQQIKSCRNCISYSVCSVRRRYADVPRADKETANACFGNDDYSKLTTHVLHAVAVNCSMYSQIGE